MSGEIRYLTFERHRVHGHNSGEFQLSHEELRKRRNLLSLIENVYDTLKMGDGERPVWDCVDSEIYSRVKIAIEAPNVDNIVVSKMFHGSFRVLYFT